MTAEATHWMLDQGIKVMGIDAITFDPPVWAMFERKQFWEAHRVMCEREYYQLENMTKLDQLPGHGFKLAVFPVIVSLASRTREPHRITDYLDLATVVASARSIPGEEVDS
jgi:kynurenine formamidase